MQAMLTSVISTGFIGLLFILNTMAIQHPFNACLGPNENQTRHLNWQPSTGFLSMAMACRAPWNRLEPWLVAGFTGGCTRMGCCYKVIHMKHPSRKPHL